MIRSVSRCGLCFNTSELRNSHLLPAALYNMARNLSVGSDPNPAVVTPSRSFTSSKQVSSPFLCAACEDRFSKNGESYVLDQCFRPNGQFKLRDLLKTVVPLESDVRYDVYDVQPLLGKEVDQYLYFAVSVFWRASAHHWRMGAERVAKISLGVRHQEQFRLYLLGKETFPDNARLVLHVSSESEPQPITVFPCVTRTNGVHRHKFYIPGLLFILILSGHAIGEFDGGALNSRERKLMWLCPWQEGSLFRGASRLVKASTPTGNLRR